MEIEIASVVLTFIFLVDLIANIAVLGCKKIWVERKTLVFEMILQLAYWTFLIADLAITEDYSPFVNFSRINCIF